MYYFFTTFPIHLSLNKFQIQPSLTCNTSSHGCYGVCVTTKTDGIVDGPQESIIRLKYRKNKDGKFKHLLDFDNNGRYCTNYCSEVGYLNTVNNGIMFSQLILIFKYIFNTKNRLLLRIILYQNV